MKIAFAWLCGSIAVSIAPHQVLANEMKYPLSIYLTYDGYDAESINKTFHKNKVDMNSLVIPLYVGVVVVQADGEMTCHEKDEFVAPYFRQECKEINSRNGVIEFVEPQMGHVALRGVSKTNPRFVEAFTNTVLVRNGFYVVRVTYGDEPDLSWSPKLENVRTYVSLEERARREKERKKPQ